MDAYSRMANNYFVNYSSILYKLQAITVLSNGPYLVGFVPYEYLASAHAHQQTLNCYLFSNQENLFSKSCSHICFVFFYTFILYNALHFKLNHKKVKSFQKWNFLNNSDLLGGLCYLFRFDTCSNNWRKINYLTKVLFWLM
jgi:hypothetical protein